MSELINSGHKKQAPPLRAGLIDTARDCNLALAAALRTNPKDSGIAWPGDANNLIMLVCNSFVNLNSKQPECHTGSDAPEILMVYRFNVIDSFPVHILAEIRQVETVTRLYPLPVSRYPRQRGTCFFPRQSISPPLWRLLCIGPCRYTRTRSLIV